MAQPHSQPPSQASTEIVETGSTPFPPATASAGGPVETAPSAETELWAGRITWKHFAARIGWCAAGNVAFAVIVVMIAKRTDWLTAGRWWLIFLGALAVSGGFVGFRIGLVILSVRYRLTSQRLFIERGILSRTTDQTELIRVDDVRFHQSLWGRMLNVGTVTLLTTDATDREVVIAGIARPQEIVELVRARMRTLRGKTVYVENI